MKKKTLLIVIIILLILLIGAGVFAYLYLGTDLLRSNKELFVKYAGQLFEEDGFFPASIEAYDNKKDTTPYESNGTISADIDVIAETESSTDMELLNSMIAYANNTNITFDGKVDRANRMVEENIQVNYTNTVNFPFTYKQDGDQYGILISDISSTYYVAVENNNIPSLLQTFGTEISATDIQNELVFPEINLTDEEKAYLQEKYLVPTITNISDDKFTKVTNSNGSVSYELNLTLEELLQIVSENLQTLSEDTATIEKLNEIIWSLQSTVITDATMPSTEETVEKILELKERVDATVPDGGSLRIVVTETDGETTKFAIETTEANDITYNYNNIDTDTSTIDNYSYYAATDTNTMEAINELFTGSLSTEELVVEEEPAVNLFEISKSQSSASSVGYSINYTRDGINYATINFSYSGLDTDSVIEHYSLMIGDSSLALVTYTLEKNVTFNTALVVEGLDSATTVVLNNYPSEQAIPFLLQYGTRLLQINSEQMTQIGYTFEFEDIYDFEELSFVANPLLIWVLGVRIPAVVENYAITEETNTETGITGEVTTDENTISNETTGDTTTDSPTLDNVLTNGIVTNTVDNTVTNETVDDTSSSSVIDTQVTAFNAQFTAYQGTITGTRVKSLLDSIDVSNTAADNELEKIQVLTISGSATVDAENINSNYTTSNYISTITDTITDTASYTVSFGYDSETGMITTVYIVTSTN